ncbi:MAG: TetR/AcrR family transcriptional regulator [Chloroflexi bacterium]|nr:TetR/AcrR family transcriptional regulator [Chloroflexota bacterium]
MTTSTRKPRTEADRKEQILAAARAVFDEKGYESATISDVVRRAGVAQGTFYLYFASKRDVVLELARRPMEEIAARMESAIAKATSFEGTIRAAAQIAFEWGRPNMDLCRLMAQAEQSSSGSVESTAGTPRMHGLTVSMFRRALDSGQMEAMDPEMAAVMFHLILRGGLSEASAKGDEAYAKQIEEATTNVLVNAFVKR